MNSGQEKKNLECYDYLRPRHKQRQQHRPFREKKRLHQNHHHHQHNGGGSERLCVNSCQRIVEAIAADPYPTPHILMLRNDRPLE